MKKTEDGDLPEADALPGAPHPRDATSLIGHKAAEQELLSAYRGGRLAHAWLIGGREGIGKATLAWRFARFVLANPDPASAGVREARDLNVEPGHTAARLVAQLAHPDFSLIRREWQPSTKKLASEISVETVRLGLQVFQLSAAFGGWRVAIVDSAEDLNRNSANALLKMVEEPPQRSLILIVSHQPGQVLATIRSRCRRLRLDPLTPDEIVEAVVEPRAALEQSRHGEDRRRRKTRKWIGSRGARSPRAGIGWGGRTDRFDRRGFAAPRSPRGREARRGDRRTRRRRGVPGLSPRALRLAHGLRPRCRAAFPEIEEIGGLMGPHPRRRARDGSAQSRPQAARSGGHRRDLRGATTLRAERLHFRCSDALARPLVGAGGVGGARNPGGYRFAAVLLLR